MHRIRRSVTYANVTATLAMFVALGGVSYAAVVLPSNSVGSSQIRANAVRASELAARSVGTSELKGGAVRLDKLDPGTLARIARATDPLGTFPKGNSACAFVPNNPNFQAPCHDVKGQAWSLKYLNSHTWSSITCPPGTVAWSTDLAVLPVVAVSTNATAWTDGALFTDPLTMPGPHHVSVTMTNWSKGNFLGGGSSTFTPIIACVQDPYPAQ